MDDEVELEALEADLAGVSDRMAGAPRRDRMDPVVRRALRTPFWDVLPSLALCGVLGWVGWRYGNQGLIAASVGLAIVRLPERFAAAGRRVREMGRPGEDLFLKCAEESGRRLQRDVVRLVLSLPAVLALLIAGIAMPGGTLAFWLAGLVVAWIPYQAVVRIPRTAAEVREARRWAGLPEEDDDEEEEEDEDEDEGALAFWWPVMTSALGLAVLYFGPVMAIFLGVRTATGPDRVHAGIALAILVVAWLYVFVFVVDRSESEE
ncbi:MAG: hypothetical protein AAFZ65_17925 [Planctomycetota bacterium]